MRRVLKDGLGLAAKNSIGYAKLSMLTIIDEYTRECLGIDVGRKLNSTNVPEKLSESFNGRIGDELLKREIFDTLYEAKVLIER